MNESPSRPLAILSAPGSRGDVNPMIAIAKQLKWEGFDCVISLAEPYLSLASEAGIEAVPAISRDSFETALSSPTVWKPIRGVRAVMQSIAGEFLEAHFDLIKQRYRPGSTILVSHPLDLSSRIFRDLDPKIPLVDVHLAPAILRNKHAPPRLTPWWFEPRRPAWIMRAAYWIADCLIIDPVIASEVNRLRRSLGLSPVRRIVDQWWLSPDLVVALYPPWFAPQTTEFDERITHAGFPLDDVNTDECISPTSHPIVFTGGTANHHCRRFFAHAANTCERLKHPGLLLSTHAENFPNQLPSIVTTRSYVSLKSLLPHCAAIVHHGGIGTTSQSMAAGIPQIVRPMAFDQFDNATRVEGLGCGLWLKRDESLQAAIQQCLDGRFARRCHEIAERLEVNEAVAIAVRQIVRLFQTKVRGNSETIR